MFRGLLATAPPRLRRTLLSTGERAGQKLIIKELKSMAFETHPLNMAARFSCLPALVFFAMPLQAELAPGPSSSEISMLLPPNILLARISCSSGIMYLCSPVSPFTAVLAVPLTICNLIG